MSPILEPSAGLLVFSIKVLFPVVVLGLKLRVKEFVVHMKGFVVHSSVDIGVVILAFGSVMLVVAES